MKNGTTNIQAGTRHNRRVPACHLFIFYILAKIHTSHRAIIMISFNKHNQRNEADKNECQKPNTGR